MQSSVPRPSEMLGCFRSPEERDQARISREIQRMLEQERKKQDKELKLLLLGELISFGARMYVTYVFVKKVFRYNPNYVFNLVFQALANLVRVRLSSK